MADAFLRAQDTILGTAITKAAVLDKDARATVQRENLGVELGLTYSAEDHIFVAKATAQASLKATLSYGKACPALRSHPDPLLAPSTRGPHPNTT